MILSPIVEAETSLVDVKRLNLSSQIQPQLFLDLDITSNLELGKPAKRILPAPSGGEFPVCRRGAEIS